MGLFFTDNLTTIQVSNILDSERIDGIDLATQAGQESNYALFRIGNDGPDDLSATVYTSDPNLSISFNPERGFGTTLSTTVKAGEVASTVFVRIVAALDASEGDRQSTVVVTPDDPYQPAILSVTYFVAEADAGSTDESKFTRYAGNDTASIIEQIETQGEALTLVRYEPQAKPQGDIIGCVPLQDFRNRNVSEWCNPQNEQVGYRATEFYARGFVGDQSLSQNIQYGEPLNLSFHDTEQIILPPDFEGFNPSPLSTVEFFSHLTPFVDGYQRTQWILKRHDGEYGLSNIREVKYFKGQFLFYLADLQRVNYPGSASDEGFLPWNQIYDADGKVIDYIRSFSREVVGDDPYDPYLVTSSPTASITFGTFYFIIPTYSGLSMINIGDNGVLIVDDVDHDATVGALALVSPDGSGWRLEADEYGVSLSCVTGDETWVTGILLRSYNGTLWTITADNDGNIVTTPEVV